MMAMTMARGMSRLGSRVSSPRAAAPSKPAKARKPKTAAAAITATPVPLGRARKPASRVRPPGAVPVPGRTRITTSSRTTSTAPISSAVSSERVTTWISRRASSSTTARTTTKTRAKSRLADDPRSFSSWSRKKPISMPEPAPMVTQAKNNAQPATKPARGPSVTPTRA